MSLRTDKSSGKKSQPSGIVGSKGELWGRGGAECGKDRFSGRGPGLCYGDKQRF